MFASQFGLSLVNNERRKGFLAAVLEFQSLCWKTFDSESMEMLKNQEREKKWNFIIPLLCRQKGILQKSEFCFRISKTWHKYEALARFSAFVGIF